GPSPVRKACRAATPSGRGWETCSQSALRERLMALVVLLAGLAVIAAAVVAVLRRIDVRLVLIVAALALGVLAGTPAVIVRTFVSTFSSEQFVVPIGCAVGFAYVLRHTGCEQHLVQLLVRPLRRARWLLIPGVVLVGFAVNVPVISQVGTA